MAAMDTEKLLRCQDEFLEQYPGGMFHPDMQAIARKHKVTQMHAKALAWCGPEALLEPMEATENLIRLVSASSLVSVFEKPRFRDWVHGLGGPGRTELAGALRQRLYGSAAHDAMEGFLRIRDLMDTGKLAKWSLLTVVPVYLDGRKEVFVKPTTTKGIIETFGISGVRYHSRPDWDFYERWRDIILGMMEMVDPCLAPDSPSFTGFLMHFL